MAGDGSRGVPAGQYAHVGAGRHPGVMYRERRSSYLNGAVVWAQSDVPAGEGRVLPDGCTDLLLWDGELVIAGPDTRAHLFSAETGTRMTGLRFPPGMGPLVFGVRAHELRDQRVPLGAVWPERTVRLLAEQAAGSPRPGRLLESVAAGRLRELADPRQGEGQGRNPGQPGVPFAPSVTRSVVGLLRQGRTVAEIALAVGLSERQLHRRCRDAFGYGPKTLARVLRMRQALRMAGDGAPLAEVAFGAGYADQAHLSREFRALAGVPVTELLAGRAAAQDRGAKRSTPLPSGSASIA
jgi:AraC-like DNA-binding protein